METYTKAKKDFLRSFLDLLNGIPSDDTFNRVLSSIDSEQFKACFMEWVSHLAKLTNREIIPIDGKTIRGANYVLAVKENQKQLYQNIQDEFRFGKNDYMGVTSFTIKNK